MIKKYRLDLIPNLTAVKLCFMTSGFKGTMLKQLLKAKLRLRSQREVPDALLYVEDGKVIAWATLLVRDDLSREFHVFVSPSKRRLGIGTRLLDEAKKFVDSKCAIVALPDSFGGHSFFEKHGFAAWTPGLNETFLRIK